MTGLPCLLAAPVSSPIRPTFTSCNNGTFNCPKEFWFLN
jgi:hypothetical protein